MTRISSFFFFSYLFQFHWIPPGNSSEICLGICTPGNCSENSPLPRLNSVWCSEISKLKPILNKKNVYFIFLERGWINIPSIKEIKTKAAEFQKRFRGKKKKLRSLQYLSVKRILIRGLDFVIFSYLENFPNRGRYIVVKFFVI